MLRRDYHRQYMQEYRAARHVEKKSGKVEKPCLICAVPFLSYPSQNRVFCSRVCQGKARQDRADRICQNPECGKSFVAKPSRVEAGGALYCSRACLEAVQNVTRRCPVCGKDFTKMASNKGVYCSLKCMGFDKRSIGGPKDTSYRGPNWVQQRQKALERDNFVCQLCPNERGLLVNVHHKTPYHNFPSYKLANVLSNLTTLCSSCHGREESLLSQQYLLFGAIPGRRRGERNHNTKISNEDVIKIRKLYAAGDTMTELAKKFGMTRPGIANIVKRKTWNHVQ